MTKKYFACTITPKLLTALVLMSAASASAAWAGEMFKAKLSGDQEVPPVVANATGRIMIQFNKMQTQAEFSLRVNGGERVRQAHLHCAPFGVNGPIVAFLAGDNAVGYDVDGKWISSVTLTDTSISNPACGATLSALATSIRAGKVYANVHSVANPGGVIRGQLEQAYGDD
jgi:hypothetical protein